MTEILRGDRGGMLGSVGDGRTGNLRFILALLALGGVVVFSVTHCLDLAAWTSLAGLPMPFSEDPAARTVQFIV